MEDTLRTDKPVTCAEAEKTLCQKLPASATSVYYLSYAGGMQVLEKYIRFHVDPTQADQAIEEVIAENNKTMKQSFPYVRTLLLPPEPAKPLIDIHGRFKPIAWWQPQTIRNGYFRGEQHSYALNIWYDSDNSLVYVFQSD